MKQLIRYTSILVLFLLSNISFAQETSSCAFKLQEAESLYETGILDSIPSMLRSCIKNDGFDKEELARAYKLLILTYQFQDYQEMAEATMLKFIKEFPEYELKATDPVEFKYLHQSFQTFPTFSVGLIGGGNGSYARIIEPYSEGNTNNYEGEYSAKYRFQGGIQLKKYITDEIDINLDVMYVSKTIDYHVLQNSYYTKYSENQSLLSFPLTATYDFSLWNINPFVRAGVNFDYLLSANANFEKTLNGISMDKETGIDITKDRNPLNVSAVIGGGLKFSIKKGYLMLDLRYNVSFMNMVNGEDRYDGLKYGLYNYVDDDFTLNNFYFSAGWVYSFYKTRRNK